MKQVRIIKFRVWDDDEKRMVYPEPGRVPFYKGNYLEEYIHEWPELRFDVGNGRTLCFDCHKKTPNYGYKAVLMEKDK
jgi:hypothetical protein